MTFRPGQSPLHRLHPATKLAWLTWVTVAVFILGAPLLPPAVALVAVLLLWLSGTPPWRAKGLRLWIILGVSILVAQVVLTRTGRPVIGPVTDEGLLAGLRAAGRLLAVVIMSSVFVTTTEPFDLARALVQLGLPYRWGFALTTALRLVAVFRVEAQHVYRAQLIRGVAYDAGGLRRWWLVLRRLCLPLLVSALRTARALSLSMEGRAFGLHTRRTWVRQTPVRVGDWLAAALLMLSVAAAVRYAW